MKAGNIILSVVGTILAGFGWMIYDANHTPPPPASGGLLSGALSSSKPVLVEFYADWCGPCRQVGPQVEELAKDLRGRAEVLRLNVDQHQDLAAQYGVHGIPCFIAFKNGKETSRQVGGIPKDMMRSMIGM